jgi:hypothetical protein
MREAFFKHVFQRFQVNWNLRDEVLWDFRMSTAELECFYFFASGINNTIKF